MKPFFWCIIGLLTIFNGHSSAKVMPTTIKNEIYSGPKFVVVLDAGHGGHDSGNRGGGFKEKEIALKVVLQVGEELEKDPRFKVIYTRKTDKFVELFERGVIANKAKADLFVSIHCNAHTTQAFGTETFVLGLHANDRNFEVAKKENAVILLEENYETNYEGFDPNAPESVIGLTLMQEEYLEQSLTLASMIQDKFTKTLKRQNRGVKQAGFVVLHKTFMPSVLVEIGFLSNKEEGKYLNSSKGQLEVSKAISLAVKNYKKTLEETYESPVETATQVAAGEIVYKIQIAAGSKLLPLTATNFKGLSMISSMKVGGLHKYYYGSSKTYSEIKKMKQKALESGYSSCFVVAIQNGKSIPITTEMRTAGE